MKRADSDKKTVSKKRTTFIYEGLCFVIDECMNVDGNPVMLTTQTDVETKDMKFPDFISILREIHPEEDTYNTQNYSKLEFKMPEEDKKGIIL